MIIGIDPSTRGIATCLLSRTGTLMHSHYWRIKPLRRGACRLDRSRAQGLHDAVLYIDALHPELIAAERPMAHGADRSISEQLLVLGALYGALGALRSPLAIQPRYDLIQPNEWRAACGIHGGADKDAVREWVYAREPALAERAATQDECDAYCVATAALARATERSPA